MHKQAWLTAVWCLLVCGCAALGTRVPTVPVRYRLEREPLVFFSDVPLPRQHRLFDDLELLREDVLNTLELPSSEEPIHVYLFGDPAAFESFLTLHYPDLPARRAIFVESDTRLAVYAHWGDRLAEDLRHETAHGYLHAVIPNVPLWLDEGLAEYFEVPRGRRGLHRDHLQRILASQAAGQRFDLARLEQLKSVQEMTQDDYAEAWAWVHFLLHSSVAPRELLHTYIYALRKGSTEQPLSALVNLRWSDPGELLREHLEALEESATPLDAG